MPRLVVSFRAVVSGVLAAALLTGCGARGDDGAPQQAVSTAAEVEVEVPEGYRRVEDPAEGYALLLPERWRDLPFSNATAVAGEFLAENPQMEQSVDALSGQGGLLLAIDPDDDGATNANLLAVESTATVDDEIGTGITQLEAAGARDIERDQVATAAGAGTSRLTYELPIVEDGRELVLQQQQYFLKSSTETYVLTLTTRDPTTNAEELTTIGESLELLPAG